MSDTKKPYALIVGWDGARYDMLGDLGLPLMEEVARTGFLQQTWMPDVDEAKTVTAPGWTTSLTGVWPAKHGITDNVEMEHHLDTYPHLMQRYLQERPEGKTLACTGAAMLGSNKGPGPILADGVSTMIFHDFRTDPMGPLGRDQEVVADASARLATSDYDLSFIYFASTDKSAHLYGTGAEYRKAIQQQDSWTQDLIDAVRSRSSFAEEDWIIVVTTDHGHLDEGGHGGPSWQERQSFIGMTKLDGRLAFQPPEDLAAVDLAPTVLAHLGISMRTDWDLDGRALT